MRVFFFGYTATVASYEIFDTAWTFLIFTAFCCKHFRFLTYSLAFSDGKIFCPRDFPTTSFSAAIFCGSEFFWPHDFPTARFSAREIFRTRLFPTTRKSDRKKMYFESLRFEKIHMRQNKVRDFSSRPYFWLDKRRKKLLRPQSMV